METPTLSSRGPKRRKTSPSKSVPIADPISATQTPRASFMSPTRASLSRFNPSLLPRPTSAGAATSRQTPQFNVQTPDPRSEFLARGQDALNYIMGEVGSAMQGVIAAAQQQAQNPMVPAVVTGDETDEQMEAIRAANRVRRLRERQETQEAETERRRSERRSIMPIERARGASSDDFEAPEMESALPDLEDYDLPDTPEALRRQLEVEDTPPRGLLFSSPSRRRRRRTNLRELVPVPVHQEPSLDRPPAPDTIEKQHEPDQQPEAEKQPLEPEQVPEKDDDILAKEAEKAKLEEELKALQSELKQYERHIDKSDDESSSEDTEDLLQLIKSSESGDSGPVQEPTPLSSLLTSFLPFSIPIQQSSPPKFSSEQEQLVPSHFPIQQKNPLPLLSLFTPLTFISTISKPSSPRSQDDPIKQVHTITLTGPGSLLTCSSDLMVSSLPTDFGSPSVDSLILHNLSPWASQEIGPQLRKHASEGDVNAIGYALGRYWDISLKRAQCWIQCCKTFRHLVTLGEDLHNNVNTEKEDISTLGETESWVRKTDVLPHLGRQFLLLQSQNVTLRVSWTLGLDWTGEVESVVSAKAALPRSWHEADNNDALKKIETTFDALVLERGVFDAVRIVVGLLFEDGDAAG